MFKAMFMILDFNTVLFTRNNLQAKQISFYEWFEIIRGKL